MDIGKELKRHPELQVRMGIHSGPVNEVTDLNAQANLARAGINADHAVSRIFACHDFPSQPNAVVSAFVGHGSRLSLRPPSVPKKHLNEAVGSSARPRSGLRRGRGLSLPRKSCENGSRRGSARASRP
jgi:hypothetical protein